MDPVHPDAEDLLKASQKYLEVKQILNEFGVSIKTAGKGRFSLCLHIENLLFCFAPTTMRKDVYI